MEIVLVLAVCASSKLPIYSCSISSTSTIVSNAKYTETIHWLFPGIFPEQEIPTEENEAAKGIYTLLKYIVVVFSSKHMCSLSTFVFAGATGKVISIDDFDLIRVIGRGSYAKVLMVELKKTRRLYAMKVIKKEMVTDDEDIDWVQTEKHVFETASNHPFLVGLHSCFQTNSRYVCHLLHFELNYFTGVKRMTPPIGLLHTSKHKSSFIPSLFAQSQKSFKSQLRG